MWTEIDTPVGPLALVATDAGLSAVHYRETDPIDPDGERQDNDPLLTAAADQIKAYFAGKDTDFTVDVDLSALTPFAQRVLAATAEIPAGETRSYGELAAQVGGSARAVGTALKNNPVPIIVPCHRVILADGAVGRYAGVDDGRKAFLLQFDRDAVELQKNRNATA